MTLNKKSQTSNGFAHVGILIGAIVMVLISAVAWRIANNQNGGLIPQFLKGDKGNYSLNIEVSADKSHAQQAYVSVYFDDSIISQNGCPERDQNFRGDATISYKNDKEAVITASQNVKPVSRSDSGGYSLCPDMVVPGFSKTLKLDPDWVRRRPDHTISLAGVNYPIIYDKNTYQLTIDHAEALDQTWFYAPGKVMLLFSHQDTGYSTCMSEAELKVYAASHKMTLVSDTAPEVETAYRQFKYGASSPDDNYYMPNILINANSHVDDILKDMQGSGGLGSDSDECKVKVSGSLTVSQN